MSKYLCIASGPSLCIDDVNLASGLRAKTIVTNNTWQMLQSADIIFSGDFSWWDNYYSYVKNGFSELWTSNEEAALKFKLNHFKIDGPYNSGLRAIQLAIYLGAKDVFLLGYDCSIRNGLHWHGEHINKLNNPTENSVYGWKKQFTKLKKNQTGVNIINCSKNTELDSFCKMNLSKAVGKYGR